MQITSVPAEAMAAEQISSPAPHKLWGGRFSAAPAASLDALNHSLPVDGRMWREDVDGSRAWVQALLRAGVLDVEEARTLDRGLRTVAHRLAEDGTVAPDEDIHSLVERMLYEEVGAIAGKLHTGRSRNDQVATDTRLWALKAVQALAVELAALQHAILGQASAHVDLIMPAYTHMRRAQPVRAAHWLLAHFWALGRDRDRLASAAERVSVLPLGSGAVSGSGFAVDRTLLKELLGFRAVSANSMDAVGDRDWVCELVFVIALVGTHLSRLAEDLILYSTDEFGFIRLPENTTTGSSLMPQKRNPDGLELARGKAARLAGDVAAALALLKGLPSGYQKDIQEDKSLLFGAFDAILLVLPVVRETVAGMTFDSERIAGALDPATLATDVADALVRAGMPFREAHGVVGRLVRLAEQMGVPFDALPRESLANVHPLLAELAEISPLASVEARDLPGGTGRGAVLEQLRLAVAALG